jgi:hypothetical protein
MKYPVRQAKTNLSLEKASAGKEVIIARGMGTGGEACARGSCRLQTRTPASLPLRHRDSFDRLLVAQAQDLGIAILSADPSLDQYDIKRVW